MSWSTWVRQIHRWVSILFTLVVAAIFAAMGMGEEPAEWVYLMPLIPLALLLPTGLYLFVLPYLVRQRSATRAGELE
jgi:ABC-type polysaccharide/polyol phosphate export permease